MDVKQVRIYSAEDVPRLRYIAGIILGDILGLPWDIVTDKRKLGKHPVINYSDENISGSFKISPDPILFETGIRARQMTVGEWNGLPLFFQTDSSSDLPFDIFSASFFLVSRYEEYLDYDADEFGRFRASSSLAFKSGFLRRPVVELWARELSKVLLKKFQTLTFKRNEFSALLTIDADQPFAYLGRNLLSSIGGLFLDFASTGGHPGDRYRSVVRGEKDPYEVFDYISENIEKYRSDAMFFLQVGDHSKFDKNPSWKNGDYRNLIQKISGKYKTGLHASYNASGNHALIDIEIARLKALVNREITMSRFHSIRFFMPHSFLALNNAGVSEDYSMGYPEEPGFRAGIARPYYFYDITDDKQTRLRIIPFLISDTMLCNNKETDPLNAKDVILDLLNETRRAGGTFVSIWHNTSLLGNPEYQGWRDVFEFMLKNQVQ